MFLFYFFHFVLSYAQWMMLLPYLIVMYIKVSGSFVQTLCIEKDSYMDAI